VIFLNGCAGDTKSKSQNHFLKNGTDGGGLPRLFSRITAENHNTSDARDKKNPTFALMGDKIQNLSTKPHTLTMRQGSQGVLRAMAKADNTKS
jgi:hypothetical protein